ncbi:MAG: alpha-amylase/alpha-mannosidase [Planctomycetota bacterium]
MSDIRLAFLWHQHQPLYKDLATGAYRMPWVRLHGVKDYYGMARLLEEAGEGVRATVNLVPSLLEQLADYSEGPATDPHLELSAKPASSLTPDEREQALDLFFLAHPDQMIWPWPRYRELFEMRRPGKASAAEVLDSFSVADMLDLQVWANLAWFHRTLLEEDEDLRELVAKGRDFEEEEKVHVLTRQREVLGEVVPLYRRLTEAGVVELTTSPYFHPILPLLVDMASAHVALPETRLPAGRVPLVEDASEHLRRAADLHERTFGERPRGLWPSEGGVSPGILPLVSAEGFDWLASDEGVLAASAGATGRREDDLYRPWRLSTPRGDLAIVFRDRELSDRISFEYQRMPGGAGARDLLGRIREHAARSELRPALVTLVLDGENPWEHYADGGVPFLRALYGELADAPDIETVRISDHLAEHPPESAIDKLHSGSWINRDFGIWIGHDEDVRAWEYVYRVREDLVRSTGSPGEENERAWRSLLAAEGSDWTWWYGDDRTSGRDDEFDDLFRTHLKNVYRFQDREPPWFLDTPVAAAHRGVREPSGFLKISLDGHERSFLEWLAAGSYRASTGETLGVLGGSMHRATEAVLREVRFGYDPEMLFLRVDLADGWRETLESRGGKGRWRLAACLATPEARRLEVPHLLAKKPRLTLEPGTLPRGRWVAVGEIVEMACPFSALGLGPGDEVALHLELRRGKELAERLPGAETVPLVVPGEDFEASEWQV